MVNMKYRIVKFIGKAAVVAYTDDEDVRRAVIISRSDLSGDVIVGGEISISDKLLEVSPEYGIDWNIIFDGAGIEITPEEMQNIFYDYGVYTADDLRENTAAVHAAIQHFVRKLSVDIKRKLSSMLGD